MGDTVTGGADSEISLTADDWSAVNDGVMGGVSQGEIIPIENGLRFQGSLSLENNGGFASAHVKVSGSDFRSIRIRLRGDGRRYQLRLKQEGDNEIAWRVIFETDRSWQTADFNLADFEPVFRGKPVMSPNPLNPEHIHQLGFLIADGNTGPFQLDITDIQFLDQ